MTEAESPIPALLSDEQIAEIARLNALPYEAITPECVSALIDHALAASAALAEREIMQPDASGSFVGDIWFGDPVRRTRGTHRWDGAKWTELPSEEEVLMGLLAEARQRVQTAEATIARQAAEIAGVKADDRYPYVYHDKGSWGRVGVSFAHDTDYVRVDMMLENGPGARWQVVEMTPDEAEQMALRLLERARTARAALTGGGGT